MNNLFKKIIGGQKNNVPQHIKASLDEAFHDPSSIEWVTRENCYEALFYRDKLENIAKIDLNGILIEHRVNVPLKQIPGPVRAYAEEQGEIMNCISIQLMHKELVYEVIVRDDKYNRTVLMLKATGEYISKIKL